LESVTGGHAGIRSIPFEHMWNSDVEKYLLVLAFAFICYVLMNRMMHAKTGRAWMAIRENEIAASVVGINTAKYKILAFAIGSMMAGIAGALYAHVIGYIAPSDFGLSKSLDLLAISVIGGMASVDGPLYGSLIYVAMPFLFSRTHISMSIVFGIILIFVVMFMPLGISYYFYLFRIKYLNRIVSFFKKSRRPYGQFIDTSMGKIHYIKHGNGKIPVVLIHGNFVSARFFEPFLKRLPDKYTAYCPDLPNFGFSDELPGDVTLDGYAKAVEAFVDALGLNNFILVGHSLGGGVVISYAIKNQSKIKKLILIDSAPINSMNISTESYTVLNMYRYNPQMIKSSLMFNAPMYPDEQFFDRMAADALRMAPKAFVGNSVALSNYDYREQAKNLNIPVYVVYGDKDAIITSEEMKRTAESFPNSRFILLKDIGHSSIIESPDDIIKLLEEEK